MPGQSSNYRSNHKSPRLWRALKVFGAIAAVVLLLLAAGVWFVRSSWPKVSGTVSVSGLQAPVEVIRDRWGVPHIFAQNSHDLFFSQGYAQAQDRMWQLEFTRRVGSGWLSEILGSDTIDIDRFMRVLGFRRAAERDWQEMHGQDRAVLETYADGVNAYLEANRGNLSIEFTVFRVEPQPWSPIDSLVIVKMMSWVLSENASIEMSRARVIAASGEDVARELLPPYNEGAPVIVTAEADGYRSLGPGLVETLRSVAGTVGRVGASNSWVIAGDRTTRGKPILANDTHLDLFIPSVWYANGIHGGDFDAVGYSLAGTPGVSIGHNRRIAWGITDLVADVQDIYLERLDNQTDPQSYEFRGEWRPLEFEREEIQVKGSGPVTINVFRTNHGPLVNQLISPFEDSRPLTLAWANEESNSLIESIIRLNQAGNWNEFRRALSLWNGPNVSFVYADVDGNVGYQAAGRIPIRAPLDKGIVPDPGWDGEYEWRGYIPFEHLPHSLNPPTGLVITANQKPVSNDYPYQLGYEFADPFRATRIAQMLSANDQVSVEDSEQIQGDTYHLPAENLREYLKSVAPANVMEQQALAELQSWNLRCDPGEAGAAIYQVWYRFFLEYTVGDELGRELTDEYLEYYWVHGPAMLKLMKEGVSRLFDDVRTEQVETRDDIVGRALADAVAWLKERYGPNPSDWKWGRLHTLSFRHRPFGSVEIPIISRLFNYGPISAPGGDRFTVNATWFTWDDPENPFAADAGTAQRIVMDLSDWDRSVGMNSTGQSEQVFHRHREDLIPLWQDLKYHPLLFSRDAIEASTENRLRLVPTSP